MQNVNHLHLVKKYILTNKYVPLTAISQIQCNNTIFALSLANFIHISPASLGFQHFGKMHNLLKTCILIQFQTKCLLKDYINSFLIEKISAIPQAIFIIKR